MERLLALALLPALVCCAGVADQEVVSASLSADDACLSSPGHEGCSMSLLQVRGLQQITAEEQSSRRRRGGHSSSPSPANSSATAAGGPKPTSAELKTLVAVIERLWKIDAPYRLQPGRDYQLNHQARANSLSSAKDAAPGPLFTRMDARKLQKQPCEKSFVALLDNYERETDKAEHVTSQESREVSTFMKQLMQTEHMKYVYNVLVAWGTIKPGYGAFTSKVQRLWFTHYSLKKRGRKASSGFEHVFVGEEKNDRRTHKPVIIGLHNWIQFYEEEKKGLMDYRGYVGSTSKGKDQLVSVRFAWNDDDPTAEMKSVSSMLVGTSVPFEFAMLTAAFLGFDGKAKLGGIFFGNIGPATITTYSWSAPEGKLIRSAFLSA